MQAIFTYKWMNVSLDCITNLKFCTNRVESAVFSACKMGMIFSILKSLRALELNIEVHGVVIQSLLRVFVLMVVIDLLCKFCNLILMCGKTSFHRDTETGKCICAESKIA